MQPSFRSLVDLFSRRFYENDVLAPDIDLRPSGIWLIALLATPGTLVPINMAKKYFFAHVIAPETVEAASWVDKSVLLTLSMLAGGVVALVCWEALLIDRRDALVLGTLPVRRRTIVGAKLFALCRAFAIVALAINVVAAVVFPLVVYAPAGTLLTIRVIPVHFGVAAIGAFATCIAGACLQTVIASLARGAALRAATALMQVSILIALMASLLLALPMANLTAGIARSGDLSALGWVAIWPPAWFLGLYQELIGRGSPVFAVLAARAAVALVVVFLVLVPTMLVIWHRALRSLVSASTSPTAARTTRRRRRVRAMALLHTPLERALFDFLLTVITRSARHRLILLSGMALAAAIVTQGVVFLATTSVRGRALTEFALPVLVLVTTIWTARSLLSLPAELPASWVVRQSAPLPAASVQTAVHRLCLLLVACPATLVALALSAWQSDLRSALAHGVFVGILALLAVEYELRQIRAVPCASAYVPGRFNLKARWPLYVVFLLFGVRAIAGFERALLADPGLPVITLLVVALGCLMYLVRRRPAAEPLDTELDTGVDWSHVQLGLKWT